MDSGRLLNASLCSASLLVGGAAFAAEPLPELCPAATEKHLFSTPDGWLMRGFDLNDEMVLPDDVVPGMEQIIAALQARGVTLAVVVVPQRGFALPDAPALAEQHGLSFDPQQAVASYGTLLAWFEARGVVTVDLASLFLEHQREHQLFFPRDHHWTQPAAQLVAGALAEALEPHRAGLRVTRFESVDRELPHRAWPGTITTQVAGLCPGFEAPDHTQPRLESKRLDPQQLGLLDEVPLPEVVVAGTSNSAYHYNFSGYLQDALSAEVLTSQIGGSGMLTALMAYLRSDAYIQATPRILVWEWIVTDLTVRRAPTPELSEQEALDQLLPSIWGPCATPLLQGSATLQEGVVPLVQAPTDGEPVLGELYLHLGVGSPSLKGFELVAHHQDGSEQRVEVAHFPRLEFSGHVYTLLPPSESGLEGLELHLPAGVSGEVRADVCGVPGG
jgi:hypothetical protein